MDLMMRQELKPLRMEGILFSTLLGERKEGGPSGFDNVTFQVCNSGMQPKDLDKIASGTCLSSASGKLRFKGFTCMVLYYSVINCDLKNDGSKLNSGGCDK